MYILKGKYATNMSISGKHSYDYPGVGLQTIVYFLLCTLLFINCAMSMRFTFIFREEKKSHFKVFRSELMTMFFK
jgi:hypothetical protein